MFFNQYPLSGSCFNRRRQYAVLRYKTNINIVDVRDKTNPQIVGSMVTKCSAMPEYPMKVFWFFGNRVDKL